MGKILFESFWFMLPAIVANTTPIIAARWHLLESLHVSVSERHLGANKTWRGLIIGTLCGTLTALLQWKIGLDISFFEYADWSKILLLGLLQSIGILDLDMLKSFFKRKLKKAPGSPWPPFDQLDFMGALVLTLFLVTPPLPHLLVILIGAPLIHAISNLISYGLGIKKVWY